MSHSLISFFSTFFFLIIKCKNKTYQQDFDKLVLLMAEQINQISHPKAPHFSNQCLNKPKELFKLVCYLHNTNIKIIKWFSKLLKSKGFIYFVMKFLFGTKC